MKFRVDLELELKLSEVSQVKAQLSEHKILV